VAGGETAVFHCELAWLGGDTVESGVRVDVDDGLITDVTHGVAAPPGSVRLAGVTIPGLANAHSHAFHRALRGRTQSGAGTFWTWRDDMYRLAATIDPESYRRLARATFAEMVLAGVTCVGEFHYVHHDRDGAPYADPNAMGEAIVDAAGAAGLRLTLLDTCYLGSGIDPDAGLLPVSGAQVRFDDRSAAAWVRRVDDLRQRHRGSPTVQVGAAVHSVRAVDPHAIVAVAEWAASNEAVLHAHVSEQPAENDQCHRAYSRSPIGLLADHGAVTSRFTAVHATHATAHDATLLAAAGSTVCMCPTTERDLADGIGPTRLFRDGAVAMCLGSDSHAVIDLFEEARAVELDERLASGERGTHGAAALLDAATAAGHRSLGWSDAGRIEVGAPADLVAVSLTSRRTAGTSVEHAIAAVVFAASAADVTDVVVGGEHVVAGGAHRRIDVAAELRDSIAAVWESAS
jgi:formiminoglutamate deiminase